MTPTISALLELHDITIQLQLVTKGLREKEAAVAAQRETLAAADAAAEAAANEVGSSDALMRQYTEDIERCDSTIEELRGKQMEAKSNKEYLAIINGVEEAKNEKKLRAESITQLQGRVADLQAAADQAATKRDALKADVEAAEDELNSLGEQADSASELQRMYDEAKTKVDPKFLTHYERLVGSNHRMPLMKVDGVTRATPYGNMVSTNQLEHIRLGELVIDSSSNSILYVAE